MTPASEIPEEMIEKVARAICDAEGWNPDDALEGFPDWMYRRSEARAALTAAGVPALLARVAELEAALAKR